MAENITAQIVAMQQRVAERLAELGYADSVSAQKISRHLAEIAVLGKAFADTTLPLFLSMNSENTQALGQLAVSLKCDLEEICDASMDVSPDLRDLMDYLNQSTRSEAK